MPGILKRVNPVFFGSCQAAPAIARPRRLGKLSKPAGAATEGFPVGRNVARFPEVVFERGQDLRREILDGRILPTGGFFLELRDVLFVILHHHLHIRRPASDFPCCSACDQARALLAFRERLGGCVPSGSSTSSNASLPDPLMAMALASFAISVNFSSVSFSSLNVCCKRSTASTSPSSSANMRTEPYPAIS